MKLPAKTVSTIFRRLDMKTQSGANGWRVTPPSYRYDIARECDLIEEVARVHGYEHLPRIAPIGKLQMNSVPETRHSLARLHDLLSDRDYQEAITYSFVDPAMQAAMDPEAEPIMLRNPIAADLAVMRSSLWPGLLRAAMHNLNRQQDRVRLYEIGKRFGVRNETRVEERVVAGCVTGDVLPPQWGTASRQADFFDIKADVEALLGRTADDWLFQPSHHPALHPGQSAEIVQANDPGRRLGWVGVMHPDLQSRFKLETPVLLFELLADELCQTPLPAFKEVSRYPSIRRDLAFVAPTTVSAATIMECVRAAAGPLLTDLKLFDLYQGEGIDSGGKSFALALTLQDSSRTLKDDEIETLIGRVVAGVAADTGAALRQ
jgi:phenylalanyl-tRNA synthetase beta chain